MKRLEREARLQQRLAAVGEMAAGIAHEIRNPLASMSGSIQLLREELPLSEEQAQLMDIVLRESERLNQTIGSFLAYARPQRAATSRLDVRTVVEDAAALLRNSAEVRDTHYVLTSMCPLQPVWYEADENQVRQIVWNLATNGLRAMKDGGRLLLSSANSGMRPVGPTWSSPSRTKAAAFLPTRSIPSSSRSGARSSGAPGSAWPTVHRIVTDYNGTIQVSSVVGDRHDDARCACRRQHEVAEALGRSACRRQERDRMTATVDVRSRGRGRRWTKRQRKPRILVVDDEPSMRDMLRIVLRRDGYDVLVAEDGRQALGVLERERVDLLLSDIRMADISGVDVLRAAKQSNPRHHRVHDDRVRVDGDRRRGDAPRRRGLFHEAIQHGRAAAEGAAARRGVAVQAGERPAEAGPELQLFVLEHHRPQRADARRLQDGRNDRQDEQHRADYRRIRDRQGSRGARRPLQFAAPRSAVRRTQLRSHSGNAARVRAVRTHARSVYRRRSEQEGAARGRPSAGRSSSTRSAR